MCSTLWQAKQKKPAGVGGTLTQLSTRPGSLCHAPLLAATESWMSLCPDIIARTACLFVCPTPVSPCVCCNICHEALQPAQLLQDLALRVAWHNCNNRIRSTFHFRLENFHFPPCLLLHSHSPRLPVPLWLHSVNTVANCYYSSIIVLCDCKGFSINRLCNNKHNHQLAISLQKFKLI